jgi:uncharacterized protein (DUF697 family)
LSEKDQTRGFGRWLTRSAQSLKAVLIPERNERVDKEITEHASAFAPVIWFLGKVQSGKTSIIRVMTGCSTAEVGNGFKACTRTARVFDFPEEAPLIRFLDTRGLGEAGYDPAEDLSFCEDQAHLVVVTMRALDPQQETIIDTVRSIRREHPEWPIVVVQTMLHQGYAPGAGHMEPYPYGEHDPVVLATAGVPADLIRSLSYQRALFDGLPGEAALRFVPIDFTLPEDDWEPADYGYDKLLAALEHVAPAAVVTSLHNLQGDAIDAFAARAQPHILGYATAAGAADIWPVAGVALVPAVQAKMIHTLATIYDAEWDRRALAEFAGALGASTLIRVASGFGVRQLAKLVPLYGQTVGATAAAVMSFATTYALGKAGCYFLARYTVGTSDPAGVAQAYKDALGQALRLARERGFNQPDSGNDE